MKIGQFVKDNLSLQYSYPKQFVISQCLPNKIYLAWATFWSVWNVTWLVLEAYFVRIGRDPSDDYWFALLTHWGYILLTVTILVDCVIAYYVQLRKKNIIDDADAQVMPWYMKINWVLYNISITISTAVTILYFSLLSLGPQINSVNFHIVNAVYVVLNLFVAKKPMKILHMIHPMIFGLTYAIFTAVHQWATGIVLYGIIDWNNLARTLPLFLGMLFIGIPFLHTLFWALTKLRNNFCCGNKVERYDIV